jgi:UDP-glucose 4-epimerase
VLDLVKAFKQANNVPVPYRIAPRRAGDIAIYFADAQLAKKLLNWETKRSLEDICRDTWRWQMQNPNGYA